MIDHLRLFHHEGRVRSCTRILRIIPEASIRGTIPPFQHEMRGRCYDSTPVFLPACADRLGVGIPEALRAVAMRARCSATATTQASHATPQALVRPPTDTPPQAIVRCVRHWLSVIGSSGSGSRVDCSLTACKHCGSGGTPYLRRWSVMNISQLGRPCRQAQ